MNGSLKQDAQRKICQYRQVVGIVLNLDVIISAGRMFHVSLYYCLKYSLYIATSQSISVKLMNEQLNSELYSVDII